MLKTSLKFDVKLWKKITTRENKKWTKKYHNKDPKKKSFGGKVIIKMKNGKTISDEINVADAHPAGNRPFKRQQYIEKFETLTNGIISKKESKRFLESVQKLRRISPGGLKRLNLEVAHRFLKRSKKPFKTIF